MWIKSLWQHINDSVPDCEVVFKELPLLPKIVEGDWVDGTWEQGEVHLYKLKNLFLVQSLFGADDAPISVCKALEYLSVKILPSLPSWVHSDKLCCVYYPKKRSLLNLLDALGDTLYVDNFNSQIQNNERELFTDFLADCCAMLMNRKIKLLQKLQLFEERSSILCTGVKYVSLEENRKVANVLTDFPVAFPEAYIVTTSSNHRELAKALGSQNIDEQTFVKNVLMAVQRGEYGDGDVIKFMKWFCLHIASFNKDKELLYNAQCIDFVNSAKSSILVKPSELFDPRIKELKTLFYGEDVFPSDEFDIFLEPLKELGLKQLLNVTAKDILSVANSLNQQQGHPIAEPFLKKADAFVKFLEANNKLLDIPIDDTKVPLYTAICCLKCIPHIYKRPRGYPNFLKWKGSEAALSSPMEVKSDKFLICAGASITLKHFSSERLDEIYKWNESPKTAIFIAQLEAIMSAYSSERRPELLSIISEVYKFMASEDLVLFDTENYKYLSKTPCIWWGDGFCKPEKIVIEKDDDDIDLEPYVRYLPVELKPFRMFLKKLGCHQKQNIEVLIDVQRTMMKKYFKLKMNKKETCKDLQLTIQILKQFYHEDIRDERLVFPIHSDDDETLIFKPVAQCTYIDTKWLQDFGTDEEENIYIVHSDIPQDLADCLGVKSLRQHLMSDTDPFGEWGQEEPLTKRLNSLLEGYQDGLSVPKELIQNADDANASKVAFIYDERENIEYRTNLLDQGMAALQGPALFVYNDARFSESDLKNITKLNGGTKQSDETKIGKFGLGFCAVYNLTDVPSFISGHDFVIFDPHKTHLGKALSGSSPGLRINLQSLKNIKILKRLHDQFKPFDGVHGCDFSQKSPFFDGTLFRLPLRIRPSEIKQQCYTRDDMFRLIDKFKASIGNMLLFTQMIVNIQIYHIPATCTDPSDAVLVCSVEKEIHPNIEATTVLQICADKKADGLLEKQPFKSLKQSKIYVKVADCQTNKGIQQCSSESNWLVSWATGVSESLDLMHSIKQKGALPLGAVAILMKEDRAFINISSLTDAPLGFYKKGHVFCYLPLPKQTTFPSHINGSFAVTADRRDLQMNNEDDTAADDTMWNEFIMSDAVVQALIHLLVSMHTVEGKTLSTDYRFYQLWPVDDDPVTNSLKRGFYQTIVRDNSPVFECENKWFGLQSCTILEKSLAYNKEIGKIAVSALKRLYSVQNQYVIDISCTYFEEIEQISGWRDVCQLVTTKEFFRNIFIPNINSKYWSTESNAQDRNKLLVYCISLSDSDLDSCLKSMECIPTLPYGCKRKPNDLVHIDGKVSEMFRKEDERFPAEDFQSSDTMLKLTELGMMNDTLYDSVLFDRAKSVSQLPSHEGLQRCKNIIKYLELSHNITTSVQQQLSQIPFLPVQAKPISWPFRWKAGDGSRHILFEKPVNLFRSTCRELVACQNYVLNEYRSEYYQESLVDHRPPTSVFVQLGVKGKSDVALSTVLEQLLIISSESNIETDAQMESYKERVVECIYKFLEGKVKEPEAAYLVMSKLADKPALFLENRFVHPSKAAFYMGHDCKPELYAVDQNKINLYPNLLKTVGVKPHFSTDTVFKVILEKHTHYNGKHLQDHELKLICNLLHCLTDQMVIENLTYDRLLSYGKDNIIAPDNENVLRPTDQLCFDDCAFISTSSSMKFVSSDLSRTCSERLGVFTKRRKCIEECSQGIPFEQKEELVTRLNGLLDGYPCDMGILKELIQNADDANATEIHFMIDFRTHGCDRIFEDSFSEFQGPALCIFNDSSFSKADLLGIQNLGSGSKNADPCKTGQYGVGFNAVYNLTDMPSFLTKGPEIEGGETLCIFDPLHKHCKKEVGVRYTNMQTLRDTFSDVLSGYNETTFFDKEQCGTVFRLPLRQSKSAISDIVMSRETLNNIMEEFKSEVFEILLFLKSVSTITISDITSGHLDTLYSVTTTLSDNERRERSEFIAMRTEIGKNLKVAKINVLNIKSFESKYEMHIKDNKGREENWFVVQRIGFSREHFSENIMKAVDKSKIGLLPQGGVAVQLPTRIKRAQISLRSKRQEKSPNRLPYGRAFCFLPLPERTGLPMHVNGHFVLDHEARRSLWKEDEGFKSDWNCYLISDIIAALYVDALKFVQHKLFVSQSKTMQRKIYLCDTIKTLEKFFPNLDDISEKYWKHLVISVYELSVANQEKFFPVVMDTGRRKRCAEIIWHAMHESGHKFSVLFTEDDNGFAMADPFLGLLKSLGMKISSTSCGVQKTLKATQCLYRELTPGSLISFLKSYNSTEPDKAKLDIVPCLVNETVYETVHYVIEVFKYCSRDKEFEKELQSLPLLVTEDGCLRCFDRNQKVFCSEFSDLLKNSTYQFVHTELVPTMQDKGLNVFRDVVKDLNIEDFTRLLQKEDFTFQSFNQEIITLSPDNNVRDWVKRFWKYVTKSFSILKPQPSFKEYLSPVIDFCLLPAVQNEKESILVKVGAMSRVIYVESFQGVYGSDIYDALKCIGIPRFNTDIISEESKKNVTSCFVSRHDPLLLLKCLVFNQNRFYGKELKTMHCKAILHYFEDNWETMSNHGESIDWIKKQLSTLPIFETKSGEHVSINKEKYTFLMLPNEMPLEGLTEWCQQTDTILIEDLGLQTLYEYLGLVCANPLDIYALHILRKFESLPDCSVFTHLEYIKDILLRKNGDNYNSKQSKIIELLQRKHLFPENNIRKKASDYFSPHHPVFAVMCEKQDFPPGCFRLPIWKAFMELIGMKNSVSAQMFIQFTNIVAREGLNKMTSLSKKKSKILVQHLLRDSNFTENYLKEISVIKFVEPHVVEMKYRNVHKQYTDTDYFVCFSNSISYQFKELIWTSLPLLPTWTDPPYTKPTIREDLGIYRGITQDSIIKHCQNVCDSLKEMFKHKKENKEELDWVKLLMEKLYECLQSHFMSGENVQKRLRYTPVVFVPDSEDFVPATQVVEELSSNQEIKPYLLKAPRYFGKYFSLFKYLGASEYASYIHYVNVVSLIQQKVQDSQLGVKYINYWFIICKAIDNMFKCLKDGKCDTHYENVKLYLPTRNKQLKDASQMVVCDSPNFEGRLGPELLENMSIFIGFEALKLYHLTNASIHLLPECLRPKYLSEVVRESVILSEIRIIHDSLFAIKLETFLHSSYFIDGLLRLIRHGSKNRRIYLTDEERDIFTSRLQHIEVRQVSNLNTCLYINNERIHASKAAKVCYICESDIRNGIEYRCIYFQEDGNTTEEKLLQSIDRFLLEMIKIISPHKIREQLLVVKVIHMLNDPHGISDMLDGQAITTHGLSSHACSSVFPDPGTYVPVELHHLLSCEFSEIEEHEYICVAFELEDTEIVDNENMSDSYNPVYIFVKILGKYTMDANNADSSISHVFEQYEIFTGTETIIVPAFKLYKLVKPDANNESRDVVDVTSMPKTNSLTKEYYIITHTLREAWTRPEEERRQIIKRLYLRWHPDKNPGNEDFCTKVFQYIKEIIYKLENGLPLDGEDDDDNSRSTRNFQQQTSASGFRYNRRRRAYTDFTASSYFAFCERLNRRCKAQRRKAEQFYGNAWEPYSRSRTGRWSGWTSSFTSNYTARQVVPDHGEAVRWFSQARIDLQHAKRTIDVQGHPAAYNWICYLCHQVSILI